MQFGTVISWHPLLAVILQNKSEIVGETGSLWKCNLVDFIEISGNRSVNKNIH